MHRNCRELKLKQTGFSLERIVFFVVVVVLFCFLPFISVSGSSTRYDCTLLVSGYT